MQSMEHNLKIWIEESLLEFFSSNDNSLIDRKLKEECINHRLAYYIEKRKPEAFSGYYIDVEYNKNGYDQKTLKIDNEIKTIRPDILIHKRIDNILDNLLAIECKIGYLNKHDKNKLRGLLGTGFKYQEAIGLSYQSNRDYYLLYIKERDYNNPIRIKKNVCSTEDAEQSLRPDNPACHDSC
jgi:hypothetical protein